MNDKTERLLSRVSIVIVTYKGDDVLRNCLASLWATCSSAPQILVVDNSPSEATRQLVAGFSNATYIESPGNPGFAGGNNIAVPFCERDFILLLNNDTVVKSSTSITDLVVFMDEHPLCGVVQGSITLPKLRNLAGGCGSFLTPLGFQYARGFGVPLTNRGLERPERCFSVMGAFMLFPKSLLEETGGFLFYDHFKSYYEESDFCHRVWLAGREVWYLPTMPIEHLCGHTSGMFPRSEIMRQYLQNTFFSLRVNFRFWGRMVVVSALFMTILAHAFVHLFRCDITTFNVDLAVLLGQFRSGKAVREARRALKRRVSDWQIFRRVVRIPPLGYFVRALRSNA